LIAPFFVKKKNGKLRLVLDCRGVNRRFHPPPPMALSAGSTWSRVSLPDGQQLSIAQSHGWFWVACLPVVGGLARFRALKIKVAHGLPPGKNV